MLTRLLCLLLALGLTACADSEPTPDPEPPATPIAVTGLSADEAAESARTMGDEAPPFTLPNATGGEVELADHLADGPVVLTFYRGTWCPYCNTELRDLQAVLPEIEAAGASLIAISPQQPDSSLSMQEKNSLTFPVLSDAGNEVSRAYGLVFSVGEDVRDRYAASGIDLAVVNGTDAWELPVPATYVIDSNGVIRFAFVEADYTQRAAPRDILEALQSL
ncbi:MAG: peroxiredoxin-like family protein [Rubricoccaceae bacterium]